MGDIGDIYGGGFDNNSVEAATGFDPIPAGWYDVMVENAEVTTTKQGNGQYLKVEMVVVGNNYANRKLFDNITLSNPSQLAVTIGQQSLAAIGLACGLQTITDSAELLGKTVSARTKVTPAVYKKDTNGNPTNEVLYEPSNAISAYKACAGMQQQTVQQPAQQPVQQVQQVQQQQQVQQPVQQQQQMQQQTVGQTNQRPWEQK